MEDETLNFINCPREFLEKKAANVVLKFKWQNAQFSFGFSINPKDLVIETTRYFETCRICFTEKQLCTSLESLPHFLLCHSLPRCNLHLRVSSQTAQHWTTKAFVVVPFRGDRTQIPSGILRPGGFQFFTQPLFTSMFPLLSLDFASGFLKCRILSTSQISFTGFTTFYQCRSYTEVVMIPEVVTIP